VVTQSRPQMFNRGPEDKIQPNSSISSLPSTGTRQASNTSRRMIRVGAVAAVACGPATMVVLADLGEAALEAAALSPFLDIRLKPNCSEYQ